MIHAATALVALPSPTSRALLASGAFAGRDPAAGQRWLEEVLAYGNPQALAHDVNLAGLTQFSEADPSKQMAAVIIGRFFLSPSSTLAGSWSPKGPFDPDSHALPLLAGLVTAAEWLGQERQVWYALDAMASTQIDYANPRVFGELPQILLDHGAYQAALDDLRFPDE